MTFPTSYNLAPVKSVLANNPRIVFGFDSLMNTPTDATRFGNQFMKGLSMGGITAIAHGYNTSSFMIPTLWMTGTTTTNQQINNANSYAVFGGAGAFGLPMNDMFEWSWNTLRLCGAFGKCVSFATVTDPLSGGVNSNTIKKDASVKIKVRALYYPHSEALSNDRGLEVFDLNHGNAGDLEATWNMKSTARRLRHLDEGDPDAASRGAPQYATINAFYPDVLMTNNFAAAGNTRVMTIGDVSRTSSYDVGTSAPASADLFTCLSGLTIYEVDGDGDWVGGTYPTFLAESGRQIQDYLDNSDAILDWLDLTTLSVTQRPLFIIASDHENYTAAQAEAKFTALIAMLDGHCSDIGLPAPIYLFLHSWYDQSKTVAINEAWGQGMFEAAKKNGRVGFYSWYSATDGLDPDASSAGDFRTWAVANGFDNFDYGTLSSQDVSTSNWRDANGTHPANEATCAALASMATDAIAAGLTSDPVVTRNRLVRGVRRPRFIR